jgi:hypothetical protein
MLGIANRGHSTIARGAVEQLIVFLQQRLAANSPPVTRNSSNPFTIASIVQQHAEPMGGDLVGQGDEFAIAAPAARRQRQPGTCTADHPVVDLDTTDCCNCHSVISDYVWQGS